MDLLSVFGSQTAGTVSNLADDVDVTIDETGTGDAAVSVADANPTFLHNRSNYGEQFLRLIQPLCLRIVIQIMQMLYTDNRYRNS